MWRKSRGFKSVGMSIERKLTKYDVTLIVLLAYSFCHPQSRIIKRTPEAITTKSKQKQHSRLEAEKGSGDEEECSKLRKMNIRKTGINK